MSAIPNGLQMLMRSAGMDPNAIKQQVEQFGTNIQRTIQHFDARLNEIDRKLDTIIQTLDKETKG